MSKYKKINSIQVIQVLQWMKRITPGLCLQLYGEYQEHQGGSGRREARRLLTERQIKKHGSHCHGKARHGHAHRSHGQDGFHGRHQHGAHNRQRPRRQSSMGAEGSREQRDEADLVSSVKKRRSYSKCRGNPRQWEGTMEKRVF